MRGWKHLPQPEALTPQLQAWFDSDVGQAVLRSERKLIEKSLINSFGYHLLQLSVDAELNFFGDCRIGCCFKAGPVAPSQKDVTHAASFVRCKFDELPFESDSIDVVVAHHVVEFASDPHALLRELYRVTLPGGRLVLIGFNPWSLFGMRMSVSQLGSADNWRNHWLSVSRMQDWLQLLGYAVEETVYGFHRLPIRKVAHWGDSEAAWIKHIPGGGIYMITAVKQVAKFIPVKKLRSRHMSVLASPVIVKPTTNAGQANSKYRIIERQNQ